MHCSEQLQAYLQQLQDRDRGVDGDSLVPPTTSPRSDDIKGRNLLLLLECACLTAAATLLEAFQSCVDEVWSEELAWLNNIDPETRRNEAHPWLLGFASLGLLPLLAFLLGQSIKHSLTALRRRTSTSKTSTSHVLTCIRKIQLTSLGRHLSHPLAPIGHDDDEEDDDAADDSKRGGSIERMGLFDARPVLHRALRGLQVDVAAVGAPDLMSPTANHAHHLSTTAYERSTSALHALSRQVLSDGIDAAISRLLFVVTDTRNKPADGATEKDQHEEDECENNNGNTTLIRLRGRTRGLLTQLTTRILLPLHLRSVSSAVAKYTRTVHAIKRGLCAEISTTHTMPMHTMPFYTHTRTHTHTHTHMDTHNHRQMQAVITSRYLTLRTGLQQLRARQEGLQARLWLCDKILSDGHLLAALASGGDAGGAGSDGDGEGCGGDGGGVVGTARYECALSVLERATRALQDGLPSEEGASTTASASASEQANELLRLLPERHEYILLCQQLCDLTAAMRGDDEAADENGSSEGAPSQQSGTSSNAPCSSSSAGQPSTSDSTRLNTTSQTLFENDKAQKPWLSRNSNSTVGFSDPFPGVVDVYTGISPSSHEHDEAVDNHGNTNSEATSRDGDNDNKNDNVREAVRRSSARGLVQELQTRIKLTTRRIERVRLSKEEASTKRKFDEMKQEEEKEGDREREREGENEGVEGENDDDGSAPETMRGEVDHHPQGEQPQPPLTQDLMALRSDKAGEGRGNLAAELRASAVRLSSLAAAGAGTREVVLGGSDEDED